MIQGPRFSTKAESRWYTQMGWDIINMTQYPEVVLACELAMCYVNISLITDYDAGVAVEEDAVQAHDILAVLSKNNANVKRVIKTMLEQMPDTRDCPCADALKYARFGLIIMQALILAAGRGTRLKPYTDDRPKPMLMIGGVPMIERIMTGIFQETDIREFVLVTGYRADAVQDHFGDGARWGWQVRYVHQSEPKGVGHAVQCAQGLLAERRFLMTYGDIMLDTVNYRNICAASRDEAAMVGLNWVDDPWRGAAVYLDDDGAILKIEEKPAPGTAATHWNNAGLFLFDPVIFHYTARLAPSPRGEYELPEAIMAMLSAGHRVQGFEITGDWRDVGTVEDYAAINKKYGAAIT